MALAIDGLTLTIRDVLRVARDGERVTLSHKARERMELSRAVVERVLARGDEVYGLTTGVGTLKRVRVASEDEATFNLRLIDNHRVGQGPLAPRDVVRAAMLRLMSGLAAGRSGVRPQLAERIGAMINGDVTPPVHLLGSLGQSDLAANADLGVAVFAGFEPAAGEALAILNNNAFSTGFAALALVDAGRLLDATEAVGALQLEAFAANISLLHPEVAPARPYHGLQAAAEHLTALLDGSYLYTSGAARNLQDPLTFRSLPHQLGAARDVLDHCLAQLEVELVAAQGNPLVLVDEGRVVSAAQFEVLPLAAALDYARIGLAPLLTSVTERTMKLLDTPWSGLPTGLTVRAGTADSGLSHFAIAAEAVTAEARLLAQPVSFELVSSTGAEGIEDRATMAPLAARRLADMVTLGEHILAMALLVAAQAVDLRAREPLGRGTRTLLALTRERVPFMGAGDALPADLEPLRELVASGALTRLPPKVPREAGIPGESGGR
ncbi:MAG: aromatic amino acid ammonia-lyase [Thermoleophilia bacterium]